MKPSESITCSTIKCPTLQNELYVLYSNESLLQLLYLQAKEDSDEEDIELTLTSAKQSAIDVSNDLLNSLSEPTESSDPIGDMARVDRALDILAALDDHERMRRHEQPNLVMNHYISRWSNSIIQ